jgi:hypothetical protein
MAEGGQGMSGPVPAGRAFHQSEPVLDIRFTLSVPEGTLRGTSGCSGTKAKLRGGAGLRGEADDSTKTNGRPKARAGSLHDGQAGSLMRGEVAGRLGSRGDTRGDRLPEYHSRGSPLGDPSFLAHVDDNAIIFHGGQSYMPQSELEPLHTRWLHTCTRFRRSRLEAC